MVQALKVSRRGTLYDVLQPGRHPKPVAETEQREYNTPGETRRVWPTLMSYERSRSFMAGRPGCVFDEASGEWDEPNAVERELAMGYEPSSTAAPGVSPRQRCKVLGQAIDLHAFFTILVSAQALAQANLMPILRGGGENLEKPVRMTVLTPAPARVADQAQQVMSTDDANGDV